MKRNQNLDILRGILILWVMFIHTVDWTGLFETDGAKFIKALFLIEMPLFFFVTGAANSMGRDKKLLSFYVGRAQRILIPYWIYGLICMVLDIILFGGNVIKLFLRWFLPIDRQHSNINFVTWAMWFVPIYLMTILAFPFLKKFYNKFKDKKLVFLPLIICALFTFVFSFIPSEGKDIMYYIKSIVFYIFWVYLGLFFTKMENRKFKEKILPVIGYVAACAVILFVMVKWCGGHMYMQENKFPPNFVFMVYTSGIIALLYAFSEYIMRVLRFVCKLKPIDFIVKTYSNNGYTIFLFHALSFAVLEKFMPLILGFCGGNEFLCFLICYVIIVIANTIIGKLFSWCEKITVVKV